MCGGSFDRLATGSSVCMAGREAHRPREECGVCGIFGHEDASRIAYFGLYALQHRGQESAGIVASDRERVRHRKGMGLVSEVFSESDLSGLTGDIAVGHVRYSTTGESSIINAQPFLATHQGQVFAVAHNGNLVNIRMLRDELEKKGSIFQSTMDSEVVVHLLARQNGGATLAEACALDAAGTEGNHGLCQLIATAQRICPRVGKTKETFGTVGCSKDGDQCQWRNRSKNSSQVTEGYAT